MSNTDMSLEDFMNKLQEFVTKFECDYRNGVRNHPDVYSLTMTEGDWWEQFTSFTL